MEGFLISSRGFLLQLQMIIIIMRSAILRGCVMKRWLMVFALIVAGPSGGPLMAAEQVNLYSARKESLIKPLLERFTAETGIEVNLVTGKAAALQKRLEVEGRNTPADLLLTSDAGRLYLAKRAGLFQAVESKVLVQAIPAHLRDGENQWFGLSKRARIIVHSKRRVKPGELSRYEDLTDSRWKGRICIRSSGNIYNQSLLASMVAHFGEPAAERWAAGVVANLARPPRGNDRAQIKAVALGECDVAVVNSYYLGKMQNARDPAERAAAAQVVPLFPNQADRGTHVNISGAGVIRHARNRENAVKLLEFLVSDEAQRWYAASNHEYPVKSGIPVSETVAAWGYPFKEDGLDMGELGRHNVAAVKIFDRVGWR